MKKLALKIKPKKIKLTLQKKKSNTTYSTKIKTEHDAFLTMLNTIISKRESENIRNILIRFLQNWWRTAYSLIPFPSASRKLTLQKVKIAIQYGLLMKAYKKYNIQYTDTFYNNYLNAKELKGGYSPTSKMLDKCEKYNLLSKCLINN